MSSCLVEPWDPSVQRAFSSNCSDMNSPEDFPFPNGSTWNDRFAADPARNERRRRGGTLVCDFRRLRHEEHQRRDQAELQRFAQSGVASWSIADGEGMCGGYAEVQARSAEFASSEASHAWRPAGAFDQSHTNVPHAVPGFFAAQQNDTSSSLGFWNDFAEFEETWASASTPAVHRLQQVRQHLEPSQPVRAPRHKLQSDRRLSTEAGVGAEESLLRPDHLTVTYFSCPHDDCHERLERLNANVPLDWKCRPCPHTGCGYVGQTVSGWIAHCTTTEHRHRGRAAVGESPTSCSRCMSVEDTHA